jgi:spore coat-associated protein N
VADNNGRKRLRPGKWTVLTGLVLLSVGVLVFSALGLFTGSAFRDHDVDAGAVVLDLDDAAEGQSLDVDATDIAPTDTIERTVDLNVSGSVSVTAITLTTTAEGVGGPASSTLDTDTTNGLQLKIEVCKTVGVATDWDDTGHPYTCSGTASTVLNTRAVIGSNLALANLDLAGMNHLRIILTFPGGSADDDANFANDASTIRFTFNGTQRSGTYK